MVIHLDCCGPNMGMAKLSPQTEFGHLTHITTLPTSMGSGMFNLKVRFNCSCFFYYIWYFSVTYFLCHDGKGDNSVHRLSLASHPAPSPCQHQWAAACLFWRIDLIFFTFFAHVSLNISDILFNYVLSVPWWEMWKRSPQTEFSLLPPPPPPCQHQWAVACLFWRLDLISFTFSAHVSFTMSISFSIMYFLCHDGKGQNSAHRLSLASCSHCSLVNTERKRHVCFESELSLPPSFAHVFAASDFYFNYILTVLPWEWW
jgi:hypothetical protein